VDVLVGLAALSVLTGLWQVHVAKLNAGGFQKKPVNLSLWTVSGQYSFPDSPLIFESAVGLN
jgi:hypothetical protein